MKLRFILFAVFITLLSCNQQKPTVEAPPTRSEEIRKHAQHYFELYKARDDWNGFLSLFRDDMIFEDVMFDFSTHSKDTFKLFYDWENPDFQKLTPETPTLVVEELLVNDSMAIGKGYFPDFKWHGELMQWADEFVICLYYDDSFKIKKQVDFVYYPDALIKDTKEYLKENGLIK